MVKLRSLVPSFFSFLAFLSVVVAPTYLLAADESGITFALLMEQVGKFHPLLLHFPLVFIMLLPLLLVVTRFSFGKIWLNTIPYFLHGATITVIPTVVAGLCAVYDPTTGPLEGNLYWHRLLTLVSTGLTILASLYYLVKMSGGRMNMERSFPIMLFMLCSLSALFLTAGAHFGALQVHGDFLVLFSE